MGVGTKSLEDRDVLMGGHTVRDKELASLERLLEMIPEAWLQDGIQ